MNLIIEQSQLFILEMKILIVEDDENSFILCKVIFTKHNIEIIRAIDGEQAIKAVKDNKDISLVIMDIKLPVMNGYEAAKIIKDYDPSIPIIAVTAFAFPEDKEKALNAGCDYYLSKPIETEELMEIVFKMAK